MNNVLTELYNKTKKIYHKINYLVQKIFVFRYTLLLILFFIWMTFLDTNSFLIHKELNDEINALESQKQELEKKIYMDKNMINNLKNIDSLEVYGRKKYNLKKIRETIYHIDIVDSI